MTNKLYTLSTMSESPAIPDAVWLDKIRGASDCSGGHLKRRFWRSVIPIDDRGEDLPYNFVDWVLINFVRDDLLEALSPHAEQYLNFGSLVDRNGIVIDGLHTIRRARSVIIRGENKSYCWRCKVCRKVQYFPIGKGYLLAKDVPNIPIFPALDLGIIVIKEPLRRTLSSRRWKRLAMDELSVLDEPLDGFPADLNKITPDLERPC